MVHCGSPARRQARLAVFAVSSQHPSAFMPAERAKKEPDPSSVARADAASAEPLSDVRAWQSVPDEQLREYLRSQETQTRIATIARARVRKGTPDHVIDDIVQDANVSALTATSLPRTRATAPGWLATVTARAVADYFRRQAVHQRWLDRDAEVEEIPGDVEEPSDDDWLLGPWLAKVVSESERDQATYELIRYRANTGKTIEQVAEDHAMTPGALKSRTFALKTKYEPRWKRRQRMFLLLLLLGALAVAALVAWLFWPPADEYLQPVRNLVVPAGPNIAAPREEPNPAPPREGD